jgi:hypothetical protein
VLRYFAPNSSHIYQRVPSDQEATIPAVWSELASLGLIFTGEVYSGRRKRRTHHDKPTGKAHPSNEKHRWR